jgi:hypothetical protein
MNSEVWLTGGRQRATTQSHELFRCDTALVLAIDIERKTARTLVEYKSRPEARPNKDSSVLFKSGHLTQNSLFLCTTTEVVILNRSTFDQENYISLPIFNDLHHVLSHPRKGVVVTSTGLDGVFQLNSCGRVVSEWSVTDEPIWSRFSKDVDYRMIISTKPHRSHPNFSFFLDDELYVNRFDQKDCICLTNPHLPSFKYGEVGGHDGILRGDFLYLTTVDGRVLIFHKKTRRLENIIDINEISDTDYALGWCRGVEVLGDGNVLVGFSRLRPTKWKQNIGWVKYRMGLSKHAPTLPTRLLCVAPNTRRILWELNLEPFGLNELFSVIAT